MALDQVEPKSARVLSDAALIAVAPVIGFALAFAFEYGFLNQFGIPVWVVRLDLTHVFLAAAAVLFFALLAGTVTRVLPPRPYLTLVNALFPSLWSAAIAAWIVSLTEWSLGWHLVAPVIMIALVSLEALRAFLGRVIGPLVRYRDRPNVWERWRVVQHRDATRPASDVAEAFFERDKSGRRLAVFGTGWLLLVGLLAFFYTGRHVASRTTSFAVLGMDPPCAVLRRYGDNIVCASIDTSRRVVGSTFRLVVVDDSAYVFRTDTLAEFRQAGNQKRPKIFTR